LTKLSVPRKSSWYIIIAVFYKNGYFHTSNRIVGRMELIHRTKPTILLRRTNNISEIELSHMIKVSKIGTQKFLRDMEEVRRIEKVKANRT